ncbi:RAB, member of RAS oncogene family-like 5 [Echinococcus multilocularis]|uniref:RAB, member of RAS oncogene family-like 5 n=1 Tax=Echinococcus multilocularis TaxID=6211 RepID=A0A0S4MNT0_ECHMU|nr:RAB, member of RAS oncogene family-like 5 [Echinococcus multilocularis]
MPQWPHRPEGAQLQCLQCPRNRNWHRLWSVFRADLHGVVAAVRKIQPRRSSEWPYRNRIGERGFVLATMHIHR